MTWKRVSTLWAFALIVACVVGFYGTAWASHRWGCWKYADASISFYNGGTGGYAAIFADESINDSNSWHNYTDVNLNQVSAAGKTDHINCYSGNYGFNGWLGIAEIRRKTGCIVKEGRSRLNTSYLENPGYGYTLTHKKHVACQEVGHLFGLHHQYQNDTCMNDSILTQPQPNIHDRDLVNSIY